MKTTKGEGILEEVSADRREDEKSEEAREETERSVLFLPLYTCILET